jgi:hypothetical protein
MKSEAVVLIEKQAWKLASEAELGHRWSQEGTCACGVSEQSVSDDGICELELRQLLLRMAGFCAGLA